jgi:hypothetical protein
VVHRETKQAEISNDQRFAHWWLIADWKFLRRKGDLFG